MSGAVAKGSTVHTTVAFAREALGEVGLDAILRSLVPPLPAKLAATEEVPFSQVVALWEAVDAVLAPAMGDWAERSGAWSIGTAGAQLYGGILRKPSPHDFLTQSVSLFRLFYHPGNMEVAAEEPGEAILRLVGFDPITPIFCRRQSGGLRRAVEMAGGASAEVHHVRCIHEGDAFCEWGLRWGPPA